MSKYSDSLEERYRQQERQARQRGISWEFTFESWQQFWMDSGKLHLRGKGTGKFVLGRRGDVGPYSCANCDVIPFEQNIRDGHRPRSERPAKNVREVRGWTFLPRQRLHPYQVMLGRKYIGCFATQSEAELAFRNAREAKVLHAQSFARASRSTPLNNLERC